MGGKATGYTSRGGKGTGDALTAEILYYHLRELGVCLALGDGCRTLELEAPQGVLTPELTDLLREHRDELLELLYVEEERAAIQEIDGRPTPSLVLQPAPAPSAVSSVFSPRQALDRARAVDADSAFTRAKETATWQPPDDFLERAEALFAE